MAANYWASTQYRFWLFSKATLADIRRKLENADHVLVQQFPLPERRHINIFFNQQLLKLARRMNLRQQAIATAQVYMRRFYLRIEMRRTNPYLVIATAIYLGCKMEECPQHIRTVVTEARNMWPEFIAADVSRLGECEFLLISIMNCQLIVQHPYRTLMELQTTLGLTQEEVSLAWSIINDHYLTDLPLLYPLHVIAATAILLTLTLKPTGGGASGGSSGSNSGSMLSGQTGVPFHVDPPSLPASTAAMLEGMTQNPGGILGQVSSETTSSPSSMTHAKPQSKVQFLTKWLAEGEIDLKAMVDCSQEIISLYDIWDSYNDKTCKEQIVRFVKARNLDK